MKTFRRVLFWAHLVAGVAAGIVILILATTGVVLSFEPQLREWAEADSRQVDPTGAGSPRLPIDELLTRVRAERPNVTIGTVVISADPGAAVRVAVGRDDGVHVNPYTGEVRPLSGAATRATMATMIRWHRYLGAGEAGRDTGRAVTGAANAAFLFLGLSGLYLWWPRRLSTRAFETVLWFRRGLVGRARDWNWHNVIGFWSLPALIVIMFSGLMISYRPVTTLIYRVAGESPPAGGNAPAAVAPVPPPTPGARPLPIEASVQAVRSTIADWKTITMRSVPRREGAVGSAAPAGASGVGAGDKRAGIPAVTLAVKAPSAGPRFSSLQLAYDPFTARLLKRESYDDYGPGRRVRTWLRFLHTGEALGWPGQLVAGLVSLGSMFLVYTGVAMALRRLWNRARRSAPLPAGERA